MSLLHDLDDFKLETSFEKDTNFVLHTSYKADRARGIRKVAVVERWAPHGPELGVGTFGTVRLQERRGEHSLESSFYFQTMRKPVRCSFLDQANPRVK